MSILFGPSKYLHCGLNFVYLTDWFLAHLAETREREKKEEKAKINNFIYGSETKRIAREKNKRKRKRARESKHVAISRIICQR